MNRFLLTVSFLFLVLGQLSCAGTVDRLLHAGSAQSGTFLAEVPIDRELELLLIPVTIAGNEYRFLLDTGAPNLIQSAVADELGLEPVHRGSVTDSNGQSESRPYVVLDDIQVGGVNFAGTAAIVTDFRHPIFDCLEVDGILGANLLSKAVWRLGPESVWITDRVESFGDLEEFDSIPFGTSTQQSPYVKVRVEGSEEMTLLVDSGSNLGLELTTKSFSKLPGSDSLPISRAYGQKPTGIYDAVVDSMFYHRASYQLSERSRGDVILSVEERTSNKIGMELLKQYELIFDWTNKRLYLRAAFPPDVRLRVHGLRLALEDGEIVVSKIYQNSPADSSDIRIGDRVLEVNGLDVSGSTLENYCTISTGASRIYDHEELVLKIEQDGNVRSLTLTKKTLL